MIVRKIRDTELKRCGEVMSMAFEFPCSDERSNEELSLIHICCAHYAHSDRYRLRVPDGEKPASEQGERDENAQIKAHSDQGARASR